MEQETLYQKMHDMLTSRGLYQASADEIMATVRAEQEADGPATHLGQPADGYPDMVIAAMWLVVKSAAVDWIDANLPLAWYRPMFESAED